MSNKDKEHWKENTLGPFAKDNPQRKEEFSTLSGIKIDTVYASDHEGAQNYDLGSGFPGEYPYTRGIYPTMYRGRLWTMRQYSGFASPEESNQRYRYLLEQGQTGLSVAFDLPTQIGYDSDHPMSKGEVGKVGVPISSLRDMEILFDRIPLDQVSTSMTINATATTLLALYIAVAKKQGIPLTKLRGTLQNDILKEYIARGTYIYPPRPSMRLVTDVFAYCAQEIPRWNTISISGYHMREAGATAVQELAFTFANALAYVEVAKNAGLQIDDFLPQLSFFFVAQTDLMEEVAKFRAARRIWAHIARERLGAKDPRSWTLRFHVQTAGVSLTAQQPDNNIVRSAFQALAAVLGGAQSLHVNSKDEALGLPNEESALLSLRTQQLIAYESGIPDTVDPLGGSYYIESLTDELEQQTLRYIDQMDQMGGAVESLEKGYQMQEIAESAFRFQQDVETRDRVIVGVNEYASGSQPILDAQRVDPRTERRQIERVQQVRRERNNVAVVANLKRLTEVAQSDDNVIPIILECVESYATLGEISDVFRSVFGEYQPVQLV
ncbi:MAG: methylmalonyl-CoA mutase family protein [Chloroflexota bacterium]|nr:methylmalonyl-CoA mutase family protein [Chloroflexota bacterium]